MNRITRAQTKAASRNLRSSSVHPKPNYRLQAPKGKRHSQASTSLKVSRKASKTTPSRKTVKKQATEESSSSDKEEEVAVTLPPATTTKRTGGKRKRAPTSSSSAQKKKKIDRAIQPTTSAPPVINNAGTSQEDLEALGIDEATFEIINAYNEPPFDTVDCTCDQPGGNGKPHSRGCPKRNPGYPPYLVNLLTTVFNHQNRPNHALSEKLANRTGLTIQVLKKWFVNKRDRVRYSMQKKEAQSASQMTVEEPARAPPVQFHRSRQGTPYPNWEHEDEDTENANEQIEEPAQTPPVQFHRSRQGTPYPNWIEENEEQVPEYADEEMDMDGAEQQSDSEDEELALEESNELPRLPPTEGSSGCSGNRISACSHEVSIEEPGQSSSGHRLGSRQRTPSSNEMEHQGPEHRDELMVVDGAKEPNGPDYEELALEEANERSPLPPTEGSSAGGSENRISFTFHQVFVQEPAQAPQMAMESAEDTYAAEYAAEAFALEEAIELPPLPPTEGSSGYSGNCILRSSHEVFNEERAGSSSAHRLGSRRETPDSNEMYNQNHPEYANKQMVMNGTEKPFTPDYEGLAVEEAYELPPPPPTEGSSSYSGNRISARSHEVSITEQDSRRYIPEHPVPLTLETIANSKTERIKFGKVSVSRVHVVAMVESIEIKENDLALSITDANRQTRVMVQKVISDSFPRNRAEEILVGDFVQILGRIRMMENGTSFLNATSLDIVPRAQYNIHESLCQISKVFHEKNLPFLPTGTRTSVPKKLGLEERAGQLDRFPIQMLEESSSVENNMGIWPKEIEELAGCMEADDSEDSDEDEEESEEESEEETEDSFDDGTEPVEQVNNASVQESPMEIEDSIEAGPDQ